MNKRSTRIKVRPAELSPAPAEVDVPDIETQIIPVHIVGISDLIVCKFSEKSKKQIEDKAKGEVTPQGRGREIRDPSAEYNAARILDEKGRDCIEGRWIKAGIVSAAGLTDKMVSKTIARSTIFVLDQLVPIECPNGPRMREDMVRVGKWPNKQPMMRYRPSYSQWSMRFRVQFEPRMVSLQRLIYLIRRFGLNVGLCEWRPEKNGEFGRFDLKLAGV